MSAEDSELVFVEGVGTCLPAKRYEALATALLSSPDPVRAVASELGDQAGRLDAICRRIATVEAKLAHLAVK